MRPCMPCVEVIHQLCSALLTSGGSLCLNCAAGQGEVCRVERACIEGGGGDPNWGGGEPRGSPGAVAVINGIGLGLLPGSTAGKAGSV